MSVVLGELLIGGIICRLMCWVDGWLFSIFLDLGFSVFYDGNKILVG